MKHFEKCSFCTGGIIPQFRHRYGGVCFKCNGSGKIEISEAAHVAKVEAVATNKSAMDALYAEQKQLQLDRENGILTQFKFDIAMDMLNRKMNKLMMEDMRR